MKQLNCDFFQMTIEFDTNVFNKKEFLQRVEKKQKKDKVFSSSFSSKDDKRKEHAHFYLGFGEKSGVLRLEFVPDHHGGEKMQEPFVEDLNEWLAELFNDKVIADLMVVFKYGNSEYESEIQLNYPLLSKNELLKSVEIVGHELKFPSESYIHKADMSNNGKDLLVLLFARFSLNLIDFEYRKIIETFNKYATALVKKKEVNK